MCTEKNCEPESAPNASILENRITYDWLRLFLTTNAAHVRLEYMPRQETERREQVKQWCTLGESRWE